VIILMQIIIGNIIKSHCVGFAKSARGYSMHMGVKLDAQIV
jgi:hypothetical protein